MKKRQQRQRMARQGLFRSVLGVPLLSARSLQGVSLPHAPAGQAPGRLADPHDLGVAETIERVPDGRGACGAWWLARYGPTKALIKCGPHDLLLPTLAGAQSPC